MNFSQILPFFRRTPSLSPGSSCFLLKVLFLLISFSSSSFLPFSVTFLYSNHYVSSLSSCCGSPWATVAHVCALFCSPSGTAEPPRQRHHVVSAGRLETRHCCRKELKPLKIFWASPFLLGCYMSASLDKFSSQWSLSSHSKFATTSTPLTLCLAAL